MSISVNISTTHIKCAPKPRSFWAKIQVALMVGRQRRQLRDLDDHMLEDIGVTRSQAHAESQESLWNVLQHWRK